MTAPEPPAPAAPAPPAALVPRGPRPHIVWLFLALAGFLFAWNAPKRDFWGPDETLSASVVREMESSGSWIVPRFLGEPHLGVPPLSYWLPAAFHSATRLEPRLAFRLPFIIVAVLGLWLTYVAGKQLFDGRIGFLAMLIQASTYTCFTQAAWLDDDLLFATGVQLAVLSFALAARQDRRPGWAFAGWAGLALAALTKSAPLAIGLAFAVIILYLFIDGGVARTFQGLRRIRLVQGFLVLVGIAGPWYAAAAWQAGGALLDQHLIAQHLGRLFNATPELHRELPYYYFLALAMGFLPWTLFLPLGLLHGKDRISRDGERLTFLWVVVMFAVLTLISSKRPGYLLVIWPPAALLIAAGLFETREIFSLWEDFLREGLCSALPKLLKIPAYLLALAAVLSILGQLDGITDERLKPVLADRETFVYGLALAFVVVALLLLTGARIRKLAQVKDTTRCAFELACGALFCLFAMTFAQAPLNAVASARQAIEAVAAQLPPGAAVGLYGTARPEVVYYLEPGRRLERFDYPDPFSGQDPALVRLKAHLEQPGPAFLVLSQAELDQLKPLFPALEARLHVWQKFRLGLREDFVLVGNAAR